MVDALVVMMVVPMMVVVMMTRRVIGAVLGERHSTATDGYGDCDGGDRRQAHDRLQHLCLLSDECGICGRCFEAA